MTTWLVTSTTADILLCSFEYYCVDVNVGRLVENVSECGTVDASPPT